jgi:hypothetical protein
MKKINSFAQIDFKSDQVQILGDCAFFTPKVYIEHIRETVENAAIDNLKSYMRGDVKIDSLYPWERWETRGLSYMLDLWNIIEEAFYKEYKKHKIKHAYYISIDSECGEIFTIELVSKD